MNSVVERADLLPTEAKPRAKRGTGTEKVLEKSLEQVPVEPEPPKNRNELPAEAQPAAEPAADRSAPEPSSTTDAPDPSE